MIIAYHIIVGTYGFWLPNDERGSGSDAVWSEALRPFGPPTKVHTTHSRADYPYDPEIRRLARERLKYPWVTLDDGQITAAVAGITDFLPKKNVILHALSIMPNHMHFVTPRHDEFTGEQLREVIKRAATRGMNKAGLNPLAAYPDKRGRLPSPWQDKGRVIFIDNTRYLKHAIGYVETNPVKHGLPRQYWECVTPYIG